MEKTKAHGPFNHRQVEALPPHPEGKRRIRYYDSENLCVVVEALPSGNVCRWWRYDYYRPGGGRGELSLGTIPGIGLAEARRLRDRNNGLVAKGIDPAHHRASAAGVQAKESTSFADASAGFLADMKRLGRVRASTLARYRNNHLVIERGPLGKRPIGALSLDTGTVKEWLLSHGNAQARTMCAYAARVFAWAILEGRCTANPAEALMKANWLPAHTAEHYRAIVEPAEAGELLRAIRTDLSDVARLAVEFLALTLTRPDNTWRAAWADIDMDAAVWTIPAAKMKKGREHVVPLSRQALAILRTMTQINVGPYVFGTLDTPLSPQTFKRVAQRIGWHDRAVAHGFRAMASTILHGEGEHAFRPHDLAAYRAIEEALAHANSMAKISGVAAASSKPYDRGSNLVLRRELMQHWADAIDKMRSGLRLVEAA